MSIRRNSLYVLGGAALPAAVFLLTVPWYLRLIGEVRYGVLAVAWALLGYFGLFDLGLGRASTQRLAALEGGAADERARAFWTALAVNAALGVLGAAVLWPTADLAFASVVDMPDALRVEARAAAPWLAALVPCVTLSAVLAGALQARERFLALALLRSGGSVLMQGLPLVIAWAIAPDLDGLVIGTLAARVAVLAVLFALAARSLELSLRPVIDLTLVGPLLRFGGWATVTGVVAPLLVLADRMLVGALLGAAAVAHYAVPSDLVRRGALLPASVASAAFPRFAARKTAEAQRRLASRATRGLAVAFTPIVIVGIAILEPFLRAWISREFADATADVGHLLAIGVWANALAQVPFTRLHAEGRPDVAALCHLGEILPYLAVLWAATAAGGLVGAAIAWNLRVAVDAVLLHRCSGAAADLPPLLPLGALVLVSGVAAAALPLDSPVRWVTIGAAFVLAAGRAWLEEGGPLRELGGRRCSADGLRDHG